jgi:hypothetical protein
MRKLVLLGVVGLLVLGLERLLAGGPRPAALAPAQNQSLSYIPSSDWDRFKELFH